MRLPIKHTVLLTVGLLAAATAGCGGDSGTRSRAPSTPARTTAPAETATTPAAPAEAVAEGWGSLKGVFKFGGTAPEAAKLSITKDVEFCGQHNLVDESLIVGKDGGLRDVVIYVRSRDVKVHPDLAALADERPIFDNKNCRFEPHLLPLLVTQTLILHNSDPVGHNSNMQPLGDQGVNPLIAPGSQVEHKFARAQALPVVVTCNIHPWMKGYVLPRDNPYFAVTGEDGSFEIKNLPSGELEFQAWQEKCGYVDTADWPRGRFTFVVHPDKENDLGTITLDPKLFEGK